MTRLSITAIAPAVSSGARSAESVIAQALDAIAAYDEVQAHAWIMRPDPQVVLAQARAVDARVAAGEQLPLARLYRRAPGLADQARALIEGS